MTSLIEKPWGYEWCAFDCGTHAVWVLHIARKRKTSLHCHPNKETTLILLSGELRVRRIYDQIRDLVQCRPLTKLGIPKGIYHQSEATSTSDIYPPCEDGAWLLEIEEPSLKDDLVRAADDYGRTGQPYETERVAYNGQILDLTQCPQKFMGYEFRWAQEPKQDGLTIPIGGKYLWIKKDSTVKVSDHIANFIAGLGIKHVFGVVGGGAMHLCDSFGHHKELTYVACHHEQAAAMAAESYARLNGLGCCMVTTGPGGTNALTGVACAWIDSIPVIFLSGQVTRDTLLEGTGVRQFGVQETDIVTLVKPITKYAVTVKDEDEIPNRLLHASRIAIQGRPGPVWVDVPLDIQSKQIPRPTLSYRYCEPEGIEPERISQCLSMLCESKRPVLIVGHGVRLAGAVEEVRKLVDDLGIPVVTSWTAADMIAEHPYHIGHCGIFGDRASNFAVQNADLLLVIGCRLSIPQIGYNWKHFAREAKIIMVDVDRNEMTKPSINDRDQTRVLQVVADAKMFIEALCERLPEWTDEASFGSGAWLKRCQAWREKYPVVLPEYAEQKSFVNSFWFVFELSKRLPSDAIVVTGTGTSFTCTFQTAKMKYGQRWINDSGHAAMGYALPGAIGTAFASGRKVICIVGDGDLQFNLQELETIAHHRLPIIIFVLNNQGYLTIKHMQANHFGRETGAGSASGLTCPSTLAIAEAYCIMAWRGPNQKKVLTDLDLVLEKEGPFIYEILMDPNQPLIPRLASRKLPDGSIASTPLEDLYPHLPREEFKAQMIVTSVEVLE